MPEVSIIIHSYKRAPLLKRVLSSIHRQLFSECEIIVVENGHDEETKLLCPKFGAQYYANIHRPDFPFVSPARAINIGVRKSSGPILIIQGADIEHVSENVIEHMIAPVRTNRMSTVVASTLALNQDGTPKEWYCHPNHNPRPIAFCQSLTREAFESIGGWDEDFVFYGRDDVDFYERLQKLGLFFITGADILTHHLYHGYVEGTWDGERNMQSSDLYWKKRDGPIVRNTNREWGTL